MRQSEPNLATVLVLIPSNCGWLSSPSSSSFQPCASPLGLGGGSLDLFSGSYSRKSSVPARVCPGMPTQAGTKGRDQRAYAPGCLLSTRGVCKPLASRRGGEPPLLLSPQSKPWGEPAEAGHPHMAGDRPSARGCGWAFACGEGWHAGLPLPWRRAVGGTTLTAGVGSRGTSPMQNTRCLGI